MGDAGELDIDELLLPGTREYTFRELAELGGMDIEDLRAWWTSAGFADLRDDDTKAFTRDDVEIVRDLAALFADGVVDADAVVPGSQALGQAMYRLAEWQAPMIRHYLEAARADDAPDPASGAALVIDRMDNLQAHIWRRHLAAATQRLMTPEADEEGDITATMAVGFADMVGYTRLSRGLAVPELSTLLSTFETRMRTVIYGGGGWIIKGVGDEVMFAADEPAAASRIALELQTPHDYPELDAIDLEFPQLRVGMAYGEVLQRYGDLFGNVVNLAARLTSAARPGTVLVDGQLAEAIADVPDLDTRSLRAYRARGFSAVHPHLLRWAKQPKENEDEA
ncbi:Adenylate/guanylate cyclase OS=Tsukamurella paurometabola (strain ATCC 8368 / DSM / CCUG 35730/ CIP 100753 / JCM 10117 / KCTC 9821 / NBRC 16120 / NCIMB 702349 / NCTC 13040) OX=521096 GN=Tpau_0212 PE=4 SV=1 [Tsukamurella paurometabola]|uniref:Adenylate/guanylate cyclase n=1 Tax=Tsukamurella paurometabola (strain ATCC 8368 / DSM 20162 / CCUG 35730 / CIP 100753 / JCM 10117 / KCTC 9821 / NBRC 16120 / NCIMB 702349 / NCTC 13040) TaxID=521096 RepID=D5UQN3_TSUPD|nr:adenylate/guanylate cyclase domain-containing protein [Tsukamurella paurometabola]ADG76866.1 adenylate/guanylate cyclase [Tsukamurella paurometabola DSM 20162]SUP41978.1 pH-sensitive adenylate cyclase Rv1264 [Tsukamurella paurometabola]